MSEDEKKDEEKKEYPNLVKFEKGQSGNPKGRPVGAKDGPRARLRRRLKTMADDEILKKFEEDKIDLEDNDYMEIIAHRLVVMASDTENPDISLRAIKLIFEQTESPMPKDINLTGDMIVNIGEKDAGNL